MGRPKKSDLTGVEDWFHGLLVGPCDRRTIRAETNCGLVTETEVGDGDDFDCSYTEWATLFRETTHRSAALGWPGRPDRSVLLNDQQRAEAALAQQALIPGPALTK